MRTGCNTHSPTLYVNTADDSLYRTCALPHLISTAAHSHTPLTIFINLHAYMYTAAQHMTCNLHVGSLHIHMGAVCM